MDLMGAWMDAWSELGWANEKGDPSRTSCILSRFSSRIVRSGCAHRCIVIARIASHRIARGVVCSL